MKINKRISISKTLDLIINFELFRTEKQPAMSQNTSVQNAPKYFCIGSNKTGTTSIKKAFEELHFKVGKQRTAELMQRDIFAQDFEPLIEYCKSAQVFQDVPFSQNEVYKKLDAAFPNSKFILTIRDSGEQWYNSMVKFHSKIFGKGNVPTWEVLKKTRYIYRGWSYENKKHVYGLTEQDDPYDKTKLINYYDTRNQAIINYFKDRPDDLLVINLSEKGAYQKFCAFIGLKSNKTDFPWENKTAEIKTK